MSLAGTRPEATGNSAGFVADDDAAPLPHFLNIALAQWEPLGEPRSVQDETKWNPVTGWLAVRQT